MSEIHKDELTQLREELNSLKAEMARLKVNNIPNIPADQSQSRRKMLRKLALAMAGTVGVVALTSSQEQTVQAAFVSDGDAFWGATSVPNGEGVPLEPTTGKYGIIGSTEGSTSTPAALGFIANTNTGVYGMSARGYGITGRGTTAPLFLVPAASGTTAPITGTHRAGELYVASNGQLFYCTVAGTPGTWVSLSSSSVPANINLLASTVRVAATTNVSNGTLPLLTAQGATPLIGNAGTAQIQFTGGVIPAGIKGVVGVLTNVGANAGGNLRFWTGGSAPNSVNLNIPGALPSLNLSASFTIPVDAGGRAYLGYGTAAGSTTGFVVDVSGYWT